MNRLPLAIAALTGIALAPWAGRGTARADNVDAKVTAPTAPEELPEIFEDQVLGGQHWRLATKRGPVHVWLPPGYEYESAGIVIYVHGHIHNADRAWAEHGLAQQFADSGRNALFIVPEAQVNRWDSIKWYSLGALIREVSEKTGLPRPDGEVVAVGHSGGYKTILQWLDYASLDRVILLDGLYGHEAPWRRWLRKAGGKAGKRLAMVAVDTLRWTEPFVRGYSDARVMDYVPETPEDLAPALAEEPLVYMRSQFDHMEIVTEGVVTPIMLHLTELPAVPAQSAQLSPQP
jgi:hypothetical protein